MKTTLTLATLVVGAALAPTLGYAQMASDQPTTTTTTTSSTSSDTSHHYVKDSAITTKIKTKLAAEHPSSLDRIHVDTDADGMVYLSGFARTQADVDKAVSIAKGTEHVTGVQNNVAVKPAD
jgi:hyperosmotically inducible periplasmic protein